MALNPKRNSAPLNAVKTRPISFRCPEDLYEQLQARAKTKRRSLSNMLEVILEDAFGEPYPGRATALDEMFAFLIGRMIQTQQFDTIDALLKQMEKWLTRIQEDYEQEKLPAAYCQEFEKAISFYKNWLEKARPTDPHV